MLKTNNELRGTRKRNQIIAYLRECDRNRVYPSIREIGRAVNLTSSSTTHNHIKVLLREGRIRMKRGRGFARNIEVVREISEICECCGGTGWPQPVLEQTLEIIIANDR